MSSNGDSNTDMRWLVLVHHFPQDPGSLRVKIWRRLQTIGAIAIKNSMYALPMNEQTQEDFQWILGEIIAGGADGAILESRFVDGMDDQQIRGLFDTARDADYASLANEIRELTERVAQTSVHEDEQKRELKSQLVKFRKKLTAIEAIDFFGANGRETVEGLLASFVQLVATDSSVSTAEETKMKKIQFNDVKGRVWVTRHNVHVDRIASAWLIRRWIDPQAVFKFTSSKKYSPNNREIRFDMFDAEFTHEGDKCTFEVLLLRFAFNDRALIRIAEIIHDLDLKDSKYNHDETAGIASLISGIAAGSDDDDYRIDRGSALLDDLYRSFQATMK